jgi:hypothetical protein
VAIVAHRSLAVAGFDPTIIFGPHNMAVQTCTGVVGQVGRSPRIDKRKHPEPNG